jgi:hypothetical protein
MIDDGDFGAIGGIKIGRGNRSARRKRAPVPLCPPQLPHDLTCVRTRVTAVGSRRLSIWAMARPSTRLWEDEWLYTTNKHLHKFYIYNKISSSSVLYDHFIFVYIKRHCRIWGSHSGGVTTYSPMNANRRFEGICRLHHQGWRVSQGRNEHERGSKQWLSCCLLYAVENRGKSDENLSLRHFLPHE